MRSERVQRRVDRLLDQAEQAADAKDWNAVRAAAQAIME